ncbi:MAG: hypothetical protein KDC87_13135 [Planctomycetes bacterium]|nr:hypothetical protein [Planctomycetota bacterium]MCB9871997.1 hypothetical protein [Planctomycetota bacterium]MCB9888402.1 hypothetical protein [Planctomycetota bacterium]
MRPARALAICCLAGLTSCSLFGSVLGKPRKEQPVSPDESYLPTGGDSINRGPDQSNLLDALEREKSRAKGLEERISRLDSELQKLKTELKTANHDLAKSREVGTSSNHEITELRASNERLETKILMLQLKNAQLEQAKILLHLAAIRSHEDALNSSRTEPAPLGGANR